MFCAPRKPGRMDKERSVKSLRFAINPHGLFCADFVAGTQRRQLGTQRQTGFSWLEFELSTRGATCSSNWGTASVAVFHRMSWLTSK